MNGFTLIIPVLIGLAILATMFRLATFLVDVLADMIQRTTYMPEEVKLARGGLAILLLGLLMVLGATLVRYLLSLT